MTADPQLDTLSLHDALPISATSNRADYWRVAWEAAGEQPLRGLGPGGFGPAWLRERPYDEPAKDAHSLPLEDRKSTRLNSSHSQSSYAVFCLKKKRLFRCNS